jgi:hypothetical protein
VLNDRTDKAGQYVKALRKSDFKVLEDGKGLIPLLSPVSARLTLCISSAT